MFPSSEPAEWLISPLRNDKILKAVFVQNHSKAFKSLKWFDQSFRVGFGLFVCFSNKPVFNKCVLCLLISETEILTFKGIKVAIIKVITFIVYLLTWKEKSRKNTIKNVTPSQALFLSGD